MFSSESLSSILGWISIACWIVVYSPQVHENYTLQSGEGLSIPFVLIWLLGDFTNLIGALLAGLLPTIIVLGIYYTTCDLILLFQIYYYRWKQRRVIDHPQTNIPGQDTPLLGGGSRLTDEVVPMEILLAKYALALAFVIAVGTGAWWITKDEEGTNGREPRQEGIKWWIIQVLGWSSASLFLGARFPQIMKNFETRCRGLSPALFFFSICGNTTYALAICAKSMDRNYLITNGGWLAGSTLTIFLDIFVLCQFSYYRYIKAPGIELGDSE